MHIAEAVTLFIGFVLMAFALGYIKRLNEEDKEYKSRLAKSQTASTKRLEERQKINCRFKNNELIEIEFFSIYKDMETIISYELRTEFIFDGYNHASLHPLGQEFRDRRISIRAKILEDGSIDIDTLNFGGNSYTHEYLLANGARFKNILEEAKDIFRLAHEKFLHEKTQFAQRLSTN